MAEINQILLFLAIKYKSDWDQIYDFIRTRSQFNEDELLRTIKNVKTDYITIVDDFYPEQLKTCTKPPFVLFLKGNKDLLNEKNKKVAVIGSRECSKYGINSTNKIISEIKNRVIVSGLAKGIDACAHKAAIESKLKTIAVLGNGFDYRYPKENSKLYDEILENDGLLISEYYDDTEPVPKNFIARNRIIAAISDFVLVTEAGYKSGTSITVCYALQFGKDVGAIPYPIDKESFCNKILKDGAIFVESGNDICKE